MGARLRVSDLARMALAWAISSLALITADRLLPGCTPSSPWWLVAAAAVTGVFGFVLRPVLVKVASAIGWLAVGAFAIAGQAVIMHIALLVLPGVDVTSFWTLVAATWIAAAIGTFLTWLATAGTDDAFTATLRGFGRRHAARYRTRDRRGGLRPARRGAVPRGPVGAAVRDDADPASLGGLAAPTASRSGPCSFRARPRPASRASCTAPSRASPPSGGTTGSSAESS